MKIKAALFLLLISWFNVSWAEYASLSDLMQKADSGDAVAQRDLGLVYVEIEDFENALKWLRMAVNEGDGIAQYNLARLYHFAQGVDKNVQQAIHYYELSAKQGNFKAINNIAYIYEHGDSVNQNFKKATSLYRKSALLGNSHAQYNLAQMHFRYGEKVNISFKEAWTWIVISAKNGHPQSLDAKKKIEPDLPKDKLAEFKAMEKQFEAEIQKNALSKNLKF